MKLSSYLGIPQPEITVNGVVRFDFNKFRKQLVAWGLQVNYDLAEPTYIVKQKTEDPEFLARLDRAIENDVNPRILELNGVIVDRITNEIVCMSYETTREVRRGIEILQERRLIDLKTNLTDTEIVAMLPEHLDTFPYITPEKLETIPMDEVSVIQRMVDGVMIRVYFYDGKWRIGTGRAIDAGKSVWSSNRSFLDLFMDTGKWDVIMNHPNLDQNNTYCFVLCHPANQQVVKHNTIQLFHVMTRNNTTLEEINIDIGIAKLPEFDKSTIKNLRELYTKMCESKDPNEGILVVLNSGMRIPMMSAEYHSISFLRGRHANLRCRAVEIVLKKNQGAEDLFCKHFPNFKGYVQSLKEQINKKGEELYNKIVYKFIKRSRIPEGNVSQKEKSIMHNIWTEYCKLRDDDRARIAKYCAEYDAKKQNQNGKGKSNKNKTNESSTGNTDIVAPKEILHYDPNVDNYTEYDPESVRESKPAVKLNTEPGVRAYIRHDKKEDINPHTMRARKLTAEFVTDRLFAQHAEFFWELLGEKPDKPHDTDWL